MPVKAKRPCARCGKLVTKTCECQTARVQERRKEHDTRRGSAHSRGYTSRWSRESKAYLKEHTFCVSCSTATRLVLARVVDHIIPHKGDQVLFWDRNNWQGMCFICHNSKTASEDGGWGKAKGTGKVRQGCGVDGVPTDSRHHWGKWPLL